MADDELTADRWARFRHAVIGPLLVSPPAHGQLRDALRALSHKAFEHPVTGAPMRVGFSRTKGIRAFSHAFNDMSGSRRGNLGRCGNVG